LKKDFPYPKKGAVGPNGERFIFKDGLPWSPEEDARLQSTLIELTKYPVDWDSICHQLNPLRTAEAFRIRAYAKRMEYPRQPRNHPWLPEDDFHLEELLSELTQVPGWKALGLSMNPQRSARAVQRRADCNGFGYIKGRKR